MSDTQPDPYEGQRPGAPQDPTPQTEAGAEESTRILPLNDQSEESLPVGPEAAPAVEAAAAQDRTAPMSPIPDEGATRTPLTDETTPVTAASAPAEAQAPRDAQAFRGAQTSADAQAPRAWMPPAAPARGPQGPSAWTGAPEAAQQAPSTLIAPRSEKKAKRGPSWFALIVSMILTAAITLSASWALMQTRSAARSVPVPSTSQGATTVTPVTSSGDSPDWQAVASAVSPAVVTIGVQSSSSSGVGSGVVYNANGDIVTNYHVISPALDGQGKITVTLADSRLYEAEIVGTDQTTDLAVIRLTNPPADLTVATFGSSSDLAVGQEVMAVGAPLGLSNTVTTGVISALNRPVEVSNTDSGSTPSDPNDPFGQLPQLQNRSTSSSDSVITNAIQVDASINPGNSGGPLFDSSGRVIGINSSIASNSGSSGQTGSIGLGFAIPVDLVSSVADQLIATGSADHAVLGVTVQSATAELDGAAVAGAKIVDVIAGGGADKAGLKIDDVVVAVDGETVSSSKQLTGYVRRYKGGDEVTVAYVRNGQKYEVSATLTSQQG
ncbi:S1C family serine protease [Schaalia hyovaginalis]|uniref:S1C family serine protease n=1 Tax=Schaalia hyovaginalis TaxID=29316 RepID=UPI0026EA6936|nr:trypsin-like peptidase domain-containing protein [Schaalia hyovaginalis]MDD7555029.1 trypsin-like peptidase domain-containing protein [Schaalia hyovaginalis]MDY3093665.1 trypsin-like peptidase domain-containing protein [Schaalia hyovaginalis]